MGGSSCAAVDTHDGNGQAGETGCWKTECTSIISKSITPYMGV